MSGLRLKDEAGHSTPPGPLEASAYEKALALAISPKPKNSARNTKRGSGNVIPMAKKPSEHSRKPQ